MPWLEDRLAEIKDRGLYRELRMVQGAQAPRIRLDDRELVNLSSNDYLGLTVHPKVKKAAVDAIGQYGTGSGAARLTSGNNDLAERLEERIADLKKTEAAMVFSTGYMANLGAISALMERGDLVVSDELNHASIIDGCRLSRADVEVFPHRDVDRAEQILARSHHRRKLVVTDGVFSMDGDIAPLPGLVEIADRHDTMVMVDDAHATGVLGKHRRGTGEYWGVEVDVAMGTLSKALGGLGGYVAGSEDLIDLLRNSARSFIYTTALPPSVMASTCAALDVIEQEDPASRLWQHVSLYTKGLRDMGFSVQSPTQIVPLMTGDAGRTLEAAAELERRGIFATGIRPPTVPRGKGRIRTSLMATHTREDITAALDAIREVKEKLDM